jgi:hypothetical protein
METIKQYAEEEATAKRAADTTAAKKSTVR